MKRFIALCLVALVSIVAVGSVLADATVVSVPSSLALAVGQEVDVPVTAANAANWYGVDVRLSYDPSIVQAVKVTRGAIPKPDWVLYERTDVVGKAWYVAISLNPTLPSSGSGLVATVRFRAIAPGVSPLTLAVQASDRRGILAVLSAAQSGSIAVGNAITATVAPAPTRTPVAPTLVPTAVPTQPQSSVATPTVKRGPGPSAP